MTIRKFDFSELRESIKVQAELLGKNQLVLVDVQQKIALLAEHVKTQNGRVGKLEQGQDDLNHRIDIENERAEEVHTALMNRIELAQTTLTNKVEQIRLSLESGGVYGKKFEWLNSKVLMGLGGLSAIGIIALIFAAIATLKALWG